jgi:hypothetical protein
MFRKAPPANSTRHVMPGDCWIGWDSVVAPVFLSDYLVLEGALQTSAGCYHHTTRFLVPW